jgi:carbonic anhydrase/acetyltransferase-like protein (isoleucine patch superfamily)
VRLVGDARSGQTSRLKQRLAIRADDGTPTVIGEGARIDDRVTLHALAGTDVRIGDKLTVGDDAVLHGPLQMGDNVTVEDDAVVFRVVVGNNVDIGEEAIVVGLAIEEGEEPSLRIPAGTAIPDGAVITDQDDLDAVLEEQ